MSKATKVDVQTMTLRTHPNWSPVTTFAVNLLDVDSHTHGNKRYYKGAGTPFVSYDDAVRLFSRVVEEPKSIETLLASIDNALRNGSYMTGANLAMDYLCEELGVDRDSLSFDPRWAASYREERKS
jgi:hypothetical protein